MNASKLRHHHVEAEGLSIHVVEGGAQGAPAVFFLHGWPENWSGFEPVMMHVGEYAHVVAIDLPGIGESRTPPQANDKRSLATHVKTVIETLELNDVTLVGHDVGGMIVYAFLHAYPNALRKAIIMDVVIPGVAPWDEVIRNPYIWHFAFHSIPDLPETLVHGREAAYFAFFYDAIAAKPGSISDARRAEYIQAYRTPSALHIGFEWYRAFPQDVKDNMAVKGETHATPVLYVRGDHERGGIEEYLRGFRENGLTNVSGHIIEECGHFSLDEQPEKVTKLIEDFTCDSDRNM
jgi:pimeloyl-ACP methyl ester carboxylesterase